MAGTNTSNNYIYYNYNYNYSMPELNWPYSGSSIYQDIDYVGYIKVDKGTPDKAQFVIFYVVENKDPMIFCKNQKEVDKEIKKLQNRQDVDKASIRIFSFCGGMKKN